MNQINDLQTQLNQHPELAAQLAALLAGVKTSSPARPRRAKKKNSERISYLTEDELAALFVAIRKDGNARDMAIFDLALGRGLRAAEVGLLTIDRLRLRDKRIFVERVKNGISNEYPLFERELRSLKTWLRERGNAPGALFPSNWKRPISRKRLDQLMRHYGAIAKLPESKRHFHCLRHTCATRLLDRGAELVQVKDHLGHRDIKSTTIYAQVTDRSRRALASQLASGW